MKYNPNYLDNLNIIPIDNLNYLNEINDSIIKNDISDDFIMGLGVDFIYTSSQIEGNSYTLAETITLLEYGRTAGGKIWTDAKMINNLKDAFNDVNNSIYSFLDEEKSISSIKDLHFTLSDELIERKMKGVVRDSSVKIGGTKYQPLSNPTQLTNELKYLVKQSLKLSGFEKAIYLHMNLSYLQYFKDVNKRTSRLVQNAVLKEEDKFYFIPKIEDISQYVESIIEYYETGSYDKYLEYFTKTYKKTLDIFNDNEVEISREI